MKTIFIIIITFLILIVGIIIVFDFKNIQQDIYNYQQIQKIRSVLETEMDKKYEFDSLKDFNKIYNQNIQPYGKNCFDVSRSISSKGYILGFKYDSFLFSVFSYYYSYPRYDIPVRIGCDSDGCRDINFEQFIRIISHPCKE